VTLRIDRSDRQRGRLGTEAGQPKVDAIGRQELAEPLTEGIRGQAAKELCWDPESRERSGGVERPAAGRVSWGRDLVDERLTADDDQDCLR